MAAATFITGFSLTADATNVFSTSPQLTGKAYAAAHADPASAQSFWDERIAGPETHAAFLDANGGARTLLSIARRTM